MKILFVGLLIASARVHAQSDNGAIPYSDEESQDERNRGELQKNSKGSPDVRDETEEEAREREQSLAAIDDPSIGLSGELLFGVLLLDSSRGAGFEPKGLFGVRFTWEISRTLSSDELFRELFFVDVAWRYSATSDGTQEINATSSYHYVSVAPAFAFPLGSNSPVSAFAQLGIGFVSNPSVLEINKAVTPLVGNKLLFQYGGGLRFRPLVLTWARGGETHTEAVNGMRVSFRIEVTRFRRGYIDDTFLGGSLGVTF